MDTHAALPGNVMAQPQAVPKSVRKAGLSHLRDEKAGKYGDSSID
jgi:hypothetical protein